MKKIIIPNTVTILNLLSGTFAIYFALLEPQKIYISAIFIFIASVFDFFDGFLARKLNATSMFGKELDSLSDVVSFGLAPTFVMFSLIKNVSDNPILPFLSFIIIVFSAIRLAIFNITDQSHEFRGLPTPALAIFVASIPLSAKFQQNLIHINIYNVYNSVFVLLTLTIIMSILLVTNVKLLNLKFKNFRFAENTTRYIFIITSVIMFIFFVWASIPLIIIIYILFSIFFRKNL